MAVKKPLTTNPLTNCPASKTIIAFITNKNKPNVRIVTGKVNNTNNGLTNIFNIAIVNATIIAVA